MTLKEDNSYRFRVKNFENVSNFRDLGGLPVTSLYDEDNNLSFSGRTSYGLVFRSATVDDASVSDVSSLCSELGIRTLIDLRSPEEYNFTDGNAIYSRYSTVKNSRFNAIISAIESRVNIEKSSYDDDNIYSNCKRYVVPLLNSSYKFGIFNYAPLDLKLRVVGHSIMDKFQNTQTAKDLVVNDIMNKMGLLWQYKTVLRLCRDKINEVLHLITNILPEPCVFHCTHGKDRTGIISVLIMLCCGVSEDTIAADYALSRQSFDRIQVEDICYKHGLSESFATANEETILALMEHIRKEYGGICNYLNYIGFKENARKILRLYLVNNS